VAAATVGLVVYLRWVMDLDRGVEIVVDVVCLGSKIGNGYG
jgi:hypothetical protein